MEALVPDGPNVRPARAEDLARMAWLEEAAFRDSWPGEMLAHELTHPRALLLVATWADGSTDTFHQTSAIWQANLRRAVVTVPAQKVLRSLALDGGIWVDADSTSDRWPRAQAKTASSSH